MKAIFGILALLVVLAAISSLAKKQLDGGLARRDADAASQAAALVADPGSRAGVAPRVVADPNAGTVAEQAKSMQQQARDRTVKALRQGADRNERADP